MSCPICGEPVQKPHRPFCSKACADRDLLNWLHGRYAVPCPEDAEDTPDPDAEGGTPINRQ
ncbi:MAG: DNA gyrase inhibitor YacG [Rhodobacteraceae bacterium]|jgi:endogenous inhibitor of DNA gyrase (YacG/DUF329 family)|nr:DNA gyrase inhibitor YacG [Paracoccaceae bacterium]